MVDFDWSTFFNLKKEEKENSIAQVKKSDVENFHWAQYSYLFHDVQISEYNEVFKTALKIEILDFCINETDFALEILSKEDYSKCLETFKRKQYDSKLLKHILKAFTCFMYNISKQTSSAGKALTRYLERDIKKRADELHEQEAEKTFAALKKQIESISSGVKGKCYLIAENPESYRKSINLECEIMKELNEYLKQKYSYDFNALNAKWKLGILVMSNGHLTDINGIFQSALYGNNDFWEKHKKFKITTFLETVYDVNSPRHAEKIINYIFANISKTQYGKKIIDKKLPLVFLKQAEFMRGLENRTLMFTFNRFNFKISDDDKLCYPFSSIINAENKLKHGKQIVDDLLREIYPDDFEFVLKNLLSEAHSPTAAFSSKKQALCNHNGESVLSVDICDKWTIPHILDFPTFGYHDGIIDREAVTVYCPDYFSAENILNRFYLKACYMSKYTNDKRTCFSNMFEVYYDLFQFIEEKTGIKTSYQRNTEGRDDAFVQLKSILKKFNVEISDKFKSDYIISLLDRKVAIREESERFPVLEQLGDAVYGLAVAETLFYSPEEIKNFAETFENYTCAKSQIKVAKLLSIDKLYLSSYSLPRKYERDILINPNKEIYTVLQESEQRENNEKYLADSLEMIIGTICKDCGYKTAIDFTKIILKQTFFNRFQNEVHWEDNKNMNIDRDYWTKILPAPYSHFEESHRVLWLAFDKFFKASVLGTDDLETRKFITVSFYNNELYDACSEYYEVNKVFYEYLHNGLESAILKYGDSVKDNYKSLEK